ncbi:hypothetical protein FRC10_009080 [Ceratobasidium sp. 414]|nr:hypothetical protein FRC10_009080 [Ceratobasidium sp. 414]
MLSGALTLIKNIASIAAEFGVECYIYSSVIKYLPDEQHAPAQGSDRYVKASIEQHVQTLDYSWTIIRPGFFMENLSPGIIGRMTDGVLRYSGSRVQFIAVEDIGLVCCAVFDDPPKFKHKILDVAGDSLSSEERNQAFIRATGHDIPGVPSILISAIHRLNANVRQPMRLGGKTQMDMTRISGKSPNTLDSPPSKNGCESDTPEVKKMQTRTA